jgi:quercetin dioxygenase-like cupin family protein
MDLLDRSINGEPTGAAKEERAIVRDNRRRLSLTTLCAAVAACHAAPARTSAEARRDTAAAPSRLAFSHALPRMDGSRLAVKIVEVTYGPGGSSRAHSHPCAVIGHVVEGALRTQVQGEPEAVYGAGQSFYEAANGVHLVSANASSTEPARLIAIFVCDREAPLSVAAPDAR